MTRKYREYTTDDIIEKSKEVYSIAGLLKELELKPVGGNYGTIKRKLQELNISTEHWTGSSWNKGAQLKDWSKYKQNSNIKKHLITLRKHKCELCKRKTWNKLPVTLEVHHIDGNRTNNELDNLQLLCPNCHSQTDNWRGRPKYETNASTIPPCPRAKL